MVCISWALIRRDKLSVEEFKEDYPRHALKRTGGRRMTKPTLTVPLFLLLTVALLSLSGCDISEPEDEDPDQEFLNRIIRTYGEMRSLA